MEAKNRKTLLAICYAKAGEFDEIIKTLKNKELVFPTPESTREDAILITDDDYPLALKSSGMPPIALYFFGNKKLLENTRKRIGFVDEFSQADTQEGIYNRSLILNGLTSDLICVVRHEKTRNDKTLGELKKLARKEIIAICDCGIDLDDPLIHYVIENNGLVLSVAPQYVKTPTTYTHEASQMLLSYLTDSIYINEIKDEKLEIMHSLSLGKGVATSPYSNFECLRYNNNLIQQGAQVILKGQDFAIWVL